MIFTAVLPAGAAAGEDADPLPVEKTGPEKKDVSSQGQKGTAGGPAGDVKWIDRPGNNMKLGGMILGGLATVPLSLGIYYLAYSGSCSGKDCSMNAASIGIGMLGVTGAIAVTAAIVGIAGYRISSAAEKAARKAGVEPYIDPLIGKKSGALSFNGAVLGFRGTF